MAITLNHSNFGRGPVEGKLRRLLNQPAVRTHLQKVTPHVHIKFVRTKPGRGQEMPCINFAGTTSRPKGRTGRLREVHAVKKMLHAIAPDLGRPFRFSNAISGHPVTIGV